MNTHSYPHVKFGSELFPYELKNITSLNFTADWALSPTNKSAVGVDAQGLNDVHCVANVALDIWADMDPALAGNETHAGIEIMIWLGVFGPAWPLGWDKKTTRFRQTVGGYTFTLYSGTGPKGQDVFTWVPDTNYTVIAHDFAPLVQHLWKTGLVDGSASVGIIAFGSEMFFSTEPVTFQAKSLAMDVEDGRPKPSAASSWKPLGRLGWLGYASTNVKQWLGHILLSACRTSTIFAGVVLVPVV
ncbi:concanavalin A-like lectin/glucanase domain-containing protein [Echria macrotheca]|uniref:Concanavalin A-like lectin/glucanase domain-containing protein n=1 Tax=Echria macrotheca TaxID=438768 RepID=A0AAJ0F7C6_9PEZI|nr:concanavalin A-like lectin/glucanase domain-containing protein [Echria macrotheca]